MKHSRKKKDGKIQRRAVQRSDAPEQVMRPFRLNSDTLSSLLSSSPRLVNERKLRSPTAKSKGGTARRGDNADDGDENAFLNAKRVAVHGSDSSHD